MDAAWASFRAGDVPPRLVAPTSRALKRLAKAIEVRDRTKTRGAVVDVAYASIDLQLRYRPVAEIDLARFELWARRLLVHATADDPAGVTSDVATMEWIRDRFVHTLDVVDVTRIDTLLGELRTNVVDEDLAAASDTVKALRELLSVLG